jgi:hydrophobe/amphiphile efflux-1 (HAE1) family protein
MFCKFFILRPVLSIVISIIIVIAGLVAILASPISQYPDITPPSIRVTAVFPGANSETIASTVASPLEDQISGITNMIYMTSSSANASNSVTITVYFEIGTDLNSALSDLLNRVNSAMPRMPIPVQQQGITVRKASPDLFLLVNFYTDGYPDKIFLSNYVYRYIYPILSQVNGIGLVSLIGNNNFAMRVKIKPQKLAYYNLSINDIINSIQEQNRPFAIGIMGMPPTNGKSQFQFMVTSKGYLKDTTEFENIIIKTIQNNNSSQIIRLKDIADINLDGQSYSTTSLKIDIKNHKIESRDSVSLLLYLAPNANQLATKDLVEKQLDQFRKTMPSGIKFYNHFDASIFVKSSISQVIFTMRDAFILVFLVVFLFIQNFRGTIIPMLAIPVSIIGTFAGTYALGFSINTLTLFGVVLAIGIVVDDAIVVLENVERIMHEEKLDSTSAAIKAMEEVASPVIAIVLVLNAVFLPVAFLGGFTGKLYQQFAVTIAISVFLSGVVALTLTPTLCALFLKNIDMHKKKHKFFILFNKYFDKLRDYYMVIVNWLINHIKTSYSIFILVIAMTIGLYKTIPTSLVPLEDMGYYFTAINLPSGASLDRTTTEAIHLSKYLHTLPAVDRTLALIGVDILDNFTNKTNAAFVVTTLKPWEKRNKIDEEINPTIMKTNMFGYMNKGSQMVAFNSPPIRALSTSGGVTFYLQANTDIKIKEIYQDSVKLVHALNKNKVVSGAMQFYDVSVPQLYIDVDRDKAKLYGIQINDIFTTLQATFGTYYVNFFEKWDNLWWIMLQSDFKYRNNPQLLNNIYIKNNNNQSIPLGSIIKTSFINGAEVVTRFNDYLASQIIVNPKTGYTSGDVMAAINDVVPQVLGNKYSIKWFGSSYQESLAGSSSTIAFIFAIIMVYLILAALYELWALPLAVLLSIPFALFGAGLLLMLFKQPNDIYFQVSLITLIGLSAKNAILIVEFALEAYHKNNVSAIDAALTGAKLRFRPIIMTSLAFILGAMPLVIASDAGANAQHSVGTGIVGGMLGSTLIATLFVPLLFITFIKKRR